MKLPLVLAAAASAAAAASSSGAKKCFQGVTDAKGHPIGAKVPASDTGACASINAPCKVINDPLNVLATSMQSSSATAVQLPALANIALHVGESLGVSFENFRGLPVGAALAHALNTTSTALAGAGSYDGVRTQFLGMTNRDAPSSGNNGTGGNGSGSGGSTGGSGSGVSTGGSGSGVSTGGSGSGVSTGDNGGSGVSTGGNGGSSTGGNGSGSAAGSDLACAPGAPCVTHFTVDLALGGLPLYYYMYVPQLTCTLRAIFLDAAGKSKSSPEVWGGLRITKIAGFATMPSAEEFQAASPAFEATHPGCQSFFGGEATEAFKAPELAVGADLHSKVVALRVEFSMTGDQVAELASKVSAMVSAPLRRALASALDADTGVVVNALKSIAQLPAFGAALGSMMAAADAASSGVITEYPLPSKGIQATVLGASSMVVAAPSTMTPAMNMVSMAVWLLSQQAASAPEAFGDWAPFFTAAVGPGSDMSGMMAPMQGVTPGQVLGGVVKLALGKRLPLSAAFQAGMRQWFTSLKLPEATAAAVTASIVDGALVAPAFLTKMVSDQLKSMPFTAAQLEGLAAALAGEEGAPASEAVASTIVQVLGSTAGGTPMPAEVTAMLTGVVEKLLLALRSPTADPFAAVTDALNAVIGAHVSALPTDALTGAQTFLTNLLNGGSGGSGSGGSGSGSGSGSGGIPDVTEASLGLTVPGICFANNLPCRLDMSLPFMLEGLPLPYYADPAVVCALRGAFLDAVGIDKSNPESWYGVQVASVYIEGSKVAGFPKDTLTNNQCAQYYPKKDPSMPSDITGNVSNGPVTGGSGGAVPNLSIPNLGLPNAARRVEEGKGVDMTSTKMDVVMDLQLPFGIAVAAASYVHSMAPSQQPNVQVDPNPSVMPNLGRRVVDSTISSTDINVPVNTIVGVPGGIDPTKPINTGLPVGVPVDTIVAMPGGIDPTKPINTGLPVDSGVPGSTNNAVSGWMVLTAAKTLYDAAGALGSVPAFNAGLADVMAKAKDSAAAKDGKAPITATTLTASAHVPTMSIFVPQLVPLGGPARRLASSSLVQIASTVFAITKGVDANSADVQKMANDFANAVSGSSANQQALKTLLQRSADAKVSDSATAFAIQMLAAGDNAGAATTAAMGMLTASTATIKNLGTTLMAFLESVKPSSGSGSGSGSSEGGNPMPDPAAILAAMGFGDFSAGMQAALSQLNANAATTSAAFETASTFMSSITSLLDMTSVEHPKSLLNVFGIDGPSVSGKDVCPGGDVTSSTARRSFFMPLSTEVTQLLGSVSSLLGIEVASCTTDGCNKPTPRPSPAARTTPPTVSTAGSKCGFGLEGSATMRAVPVGYKCARFAVTCKKADGMYCSASDAQARAIKNVLYALPGAAFADLMSFLNARDEAQTAAYLDAELDSSTAALPVAGPNTTEIASALSRVVYATSASAVTNGLPAPSSTELSFLASVDSQSVAAAEVVVDNVPAASSSRTPSVSPTAARTMTPTRSPTSSTSATPSVTPSVTPTRSVPRTRTPSRTPSGTTVSEEASKMPTPSTTATASPKPERKSFSIKMNLNNLPLGMYAFPEVSCALRGAFLDIITAPRANPASWAFVTLQSATGLTDNGVLTQDEINSDVCHTLYPETLPLPPARRLAAGAAARALLTDAEKVQQSLDLKVELTVLVEVPIALFDKFKDDVTRRRMLSAIDEILARLASLQQQAAANSVIAAAINTMVAQAVTIANDPATVADMPALAHVAQTVTSIEAVVASIVDPNAPKDEGGLTPGQRTAIIAGIVAPVGTILVVAAAMYAMKARKAIAMTRAVSASTAAAVEPPAFAKAVDVAVAGECEDPVAFKGSQV